MQVEYIGALQIILGVIARFWPVWLAMAIVIGASVFYKKKLGLYGQVYDNNVGIAGVLICFFWLFTAIFASTVAPYDPLAQIPVMKDARADVRKQTTSAMSSGVAMRPSL